MKFLDIYHKFMNQTSQFKVISKKFLGKVQGRQRLVLAPKPDKTPLAQQLYRIIDQ